MKVCVPVSRGCFETYSVTQEDDESVGAALARFGRDVLGKALSVDFCWYEKDQAHCIAKPVSDEGYTAAALSRHLYDARTLPLVEDSDERCEIFDLDLPAVQVVAGRL